MSLTFEIAMQTVACAASEYMEERNGALMITKDGLEKLIDKHFPNFEKVIMARLAFCVEVTFLTGLMDGSG